MMRWFRAVLGLCVLVCESVVAGTSFDRWYVITLDDQRVGYSHTSETEHNGEVTTFTETRISIRRGEDGLDITQQLQFVETNQGEPLRAVSTMGLGRSPVQTTYVFAEAGIEMTIVQGDQKRVAYLPPVAGFWLTPAAAQRFTEQQMQAGQKQISFRTIDISMAPTAMDVDLSVVGEKMIAVLGKTVPAVEWEVTQSLLPGVVERQFVDQEGRTRITRMDLGFGGLAVEMIEADEAVARADVDPPEIMARTLVRPDRGIEHPRLLRSALYELKITGEEDLPSVSLPRGGYQRVVWGDHRTARVVVDLDSPVNPLDDLPSAEHQATSTVLNHNDQKLRQLIAEALGEDPLALDPIEQSHRLRDFVHLYIEKKDLAIGFATAGEVARTAQGDCSEHAVLLAAMLRGVEIPSRTVSGLLYVEEFLGRIGVFGYHMWTQAWLPSPLGEHWVDLDATLVDREFDAAHIALAYSSLSDRSMVNDLVALAPLFDRLQVKILEVADR